MNFVGKYIQSQCLYDGDCEHCSKYCEPRWNLAESVGCSEYLMWMLQFRRNCVVHHKIADKIADMLNATSEERDSIVSAEHKGTYASKRIRRVKRSPRYNAKEIVLVDRTGAIIKKYASIMETVDNLKCCTAPTIVNRCNRVHTTRIKDEFEPYGMTFRFAEEWEAMSDEERRNDLIQPKR